MSVNASCVTVGDFDADGKPDLFIGARSIPGSYGVSPASVLLHNEGGGVFTDVTATMAPELQKAGMVTDAAWADLSGKGKKELVLAGDWMPITIYAYENKQFKKKTTIPNSSGWWNCITVADIDGNGSQDLVAGNMGMNSNIKADPQHPAKLFVDDFDKNGQTECIPVYYKPDGKAYPYYLKDELESQLPVLKKKFLRYEAYAGKTMEEILSKEQLAHARVLTAEQSQSAVFLNTGTGTFTMQALPVMAQLSPVFGITVTDLNGDGKKDLFLAGNFHGLKPQTGRFDASYGTTLLNNRQHQFQYVKPKQTGLFINGEARATALVNAANGGSYVLVAMNNDKLYLFRKKQ